MEGMSATHRVGFEVRGIRVVVTCHPEGAAGQPAYLAELCQGGEVAVGQLVRTGNSCCLEVLEAPDWLHERCSMPAPGYAHGVTDGETVWLEVPPLVRAEVVLPWLEWHRHAERARRSA
jgi:hypothetical protein